MRRGFDGLAADVAQTLRADPYSGAAFVFRSKRGDYVKRRSNWALIESPVCASSI
jgi:transposase